MAPALPICDGCVSVSTDCRPLPFPFQYYTRMVESPLYRQHDEMKRRHESVMKRLHGLRDETREHVEQVCVPWGCAGLKEPSRKRPHSNGLATMSPLATVPHLPLCPTRVPPTPDPFCPPLQQLGMHLNRIENEIKIKNQQKEKSADGGSSGTSISEEEAAYLRVYLSQVRYSGRASHDCPYSWRCKMWSSR
jgi:hypothetical protein